MKSVGKNRSEFREKCFTHKWLPQQKCEKRNQDDKVQVELNRSNRRLNVVPFFSGKT